VSTDSAPAARPGRAPSASACEPYRELVAEALGRGRNAMAIWQDLVDDHGLRARYASVRRFVQTLRGTTAAEARVVITTAPGEEGQVDYGDGPMVRHPQTGQYRRTRLFVLTLGRSNRLVECRRRRKTQTCWILEDHRCVLRPQEVGAESGKPSTKGGRGGPRCRSQNR